jgi:hypothetical protein
MTTPSGNRSLTGERPITMRSRVRVVLVVAVAVAGGCGGEAAGTLPSSSTTTPTRSTTDHGAATSVVRAASTPPTEVAQVDVWEQSTIALVTAGIRTQSDRPAEASVTALASTSVGFVAAGSVNGGFAVWRSDDLGPFEPVYSEVCCQRSLSATAIGEFDGSLIITGSAELGPERRQQAFLLRSGDGGASWTLIDHPAFATNANRVDRMHVSGDAVLVDAVDDRVSGEPQSVAVWSDDLDSWHPVELPGRRPGDGPRFIQGGGATVFAIAHRNDGPEGRFSETAIWRSDDGGRRFAEQPPLLEPGVGDFLAVGDTLVAVPTVFTSDVVHADAPGRFILTAGDEWRELGADTGTWGDGRIATYQTAMSDATGHTYALVARTMRASPHYCYDDIDTCHQGELVLLATDDGATWFDVAGFPGLGLAGDPWLLTTSVAGEVVILGAGDYGTPIYVTRSTGGAPPPEIERPDYPPPDIPVALVGHAEPFEVGDERRYALGLGGCAGMYLDDQRWLPETPLPDPPPPEWPHRAVDIADGPTGYVYGRVHRLDADTVEFSIEGIGPVATFHPGPMPEYACG